MCNFYPIFLLDPGLSPGLSSFSGPSYNFRFIAVLLMYFCFGLLGLSGIIGTICPPASKGLIIFSLKCERDLYPQNSFISFRVFGVLQNSKILSSSSDSWGQLRFVSFPCLSFPIFSGEWRTPPPNPLCYHRYLFEGWLQWDTWGH